MSDEVFGDDFDDEDDFENRRSSGGLGGKRLLLIILFLVVVVLGAAAAFLFVTDTGKGIVDSIFGGSSSAPASIEKVEPDQQTANEERATPSEGGGIQFDPKFVPVPPLLVNLQSADARRRNSFLKLEIWIEVDGTQQSQVEKAMPKIVDTLQVYLRGLRVEELQGSAGIDRLRRDILIRVAKAAESFGASVRDVLFKEMLVQ